MLITLLAAPDLCNAGPDAAMVTAVEQSAAVGAAGNLHGFPAVLTSFVGRTLVVDEIATHLDRCRLVTVTGPGGAGKTRMAGEVARRVAGRFADGVWLAGLATVRDPAQVALCVGAALGIRDLPSVATGDALAQVLARRQLLLVLDNCEHVIGAAAELCGRLLLGADDVRVLATSREPLRMAGELRYRLGPLTLPDPGDVAAAGESEAVTLFADRARQVDPGFVLDEAVGPLVARLDGLPLAIELAAARVDALGVAQLLDRIDDRFRLLIDADRLADERQRSLAAAVRWSYELLDDAERRAFRAVSVFPGPFTLEGAGAVAGPGAELAVLRLVDCSLLTAPRVDPDGRSRYQMLETLRAYGAGLLAAAGENGDVSAALARYAAAVAEQASAGLHTGSGEGASLRQLDAEDATMRQALTWAMDHDPGTALRLALAIEPWWQIRGQLTSQAPLLADAAEHAEPGGDQWCAARLCLGQAAGQLADRVVALEHFTAVRDVLEDTERPASPTGTVLLALCLCGRSGVLASLDRIEEGLGDGRRAVALARELGSPGLDAMALACLATGAWRAGDRDGALRLVHQAQQIPGDVAGALRRALGMMAIGILIEAGDLTAAEQASAEGLAWCREAGDLTTLSSHLWSAAILDLRAGRTGDAAAHLREQLQIAVQTGLRPMQLAGLDGCGHLCAATRRHAEAVTMWAARSALGGPRSLPFGSLNPERRDELLRAARRALGPAGTRAAQERGASMSLAAATEYALMLADAEPRLPATDGAAAPGRTGLSPRERELVTLVAQGRTDAQIAAQLYITVRTVSSHLDRIRDKTGCRRRADLTRLALRDGLV
jgi:predicted ATPase/DNA-binding CsgD family transcriptional regulator